MLCHVHMLSMVQDILHASHTEGLRCVFVTMSEACIRRLQPASVVLQFNMAEADLLQCQTCLSAL